MTDRLAEMKAMVLDVAKRVNGDEFFIGLISKLETSMNLICNEKNDIADDDMITLEKNLNALVGKLHSTQNDMYNYSQLISNLQIKYTIPDDSIISKKNIKNLNKEIERFDKNVLLRYVNKNNKKLEE